MEWTKYAADVYGDQWQRVYQAAFKMEMKAWARKRSFWSWLQKQRKKECELSATISLKELRPGNSIYAEIGNGSIETTYYDKTTIKMIPVLFLCRDRDQQKCIDQLSRICNYFQRLTKYPHGQSFVWLDSTISKVPSKIGRDEDGMYHGSCILNNKIYCWKDRWIWKKLICKFLPSRSCRQILKPQKGTGKPSVYQYDAGRRHGNMGEYGEPSEKYGTVSERSFVPGHLLEG